MIATIVINHQSKEWDSLIFDLKPLVQLIFEDLLEYFGLMSYPGEAEISLLFTDDLAIRELNKKFRNKDKATNVLSFPDQQVIPSSFFNYTEDIGVRGADCTTCLHEHPDRTRSNEELKNGFGINLDNVGAIIAKNRYIYLGDIAFAFETIAKEAQLNKKRLLDHFAHLMIHSTLHLLGYDHKIDEEATKMQQLEIALLARISIRSPYDDQT